MFDQIMQGRWWDRAWSLVDNCTPVSAGCDHCWLAGMEKRFHKTDGVVRFREDRLQIPLRVKKPTAWAVWSDLFHEAVSFGEINKAFVVMERCPQHVFLILTKRPERAITTKGARNLPGNVWFGVTAENQEQADRRIPVLLQIPAAVRWVSVEPMLGPVNLKLFLPLTEHGRGGPIRATDGVDWVVLGGESGHGARPMHPDWARSVRDQCQAAGVPFLFKQWGEWKHSFDLERDDPDLRNLPDIENRTPKGQWLNLNGGQGFHGERVHRMERIGKRRSGRVLDGRLWDGVPKL